ncbi:hypothetical protein DL93DRAFT_2091093 [Clavulina sp. PMI_390]|nr:hypothetical protein DL93DRAFT_2091093 [Clavulina sp. PMI_390]
MGCIDQTSVFRAQVKDLARRYPPPTSKKGRKATSKTTNDASLGTEDGFLAEAYAILKHITTLSDLLSGIRRAYLNVDVQAPKYAQRSFDAGASSSWSSAKTMTNEERDQLDLQARVILGQCADRVSKLEQLEKVRSNKVIAETNPLQRFLPSLIPATTSTAHSELIAAHRTNITWYLTRRLADVSAFQKDMQEERVKRQLERARTLGGSAFGGLPAPGSSSKPGESSMSSSYSSFQFVPPPVTSTSQQHLLEDDDSDFDDEADTELTPAQIQQFEEENAAILRQQENLLASVKQAESRLMDISALQTELVMQLQRQTEMVDTLYDEAIASQTEVEKGNDQLRRARERGRSSRKWILMFMLLATFTLLFLHWYN